MYLLWPAGSTHPHLHCPFLTHPHWLSGFYTPLTLPILPLPPRSKLHRTPKPSFFFFFFSKWLHFCWFYLHCDHFIFGSLVDQVDLGRIRKSKCLHFLGNGGFLLTTFLICSLVCHMISFRLTTDS